MMEKKVVCVGLVCVDLVNICSDFPKEDTDQRINSLQWRRGGNAANTSVVLSLLGTAVDFVGVVPSTSDSNNTSWGIAAAKHAKSDLRKNGVGIEHVTECHTVDFPTSTVIVNAENGSRTIMHYRGDFPELTVDNILQLSMDEFDWFHFESRPNHDVICSCVAKIKENNCKTTVSMELEKITTFDADPSLQFAKLADLVFVSKEFASHMKCRDAIEAVEHVHGLLPRAAVICTWGNAGAAYFENGKGHRVGAASVNKVVDTLGAGDSFIGGVIHAMHRGASLGDSVAFGCRVAERKIADLGFSHVADMSGTRFG